MPGQPRLLLRPLRLRRDVALSTCTQTDLDAWHAEKYATRRPAQAFLRWCMDSRRMPRLSIPNRPTSNPHPMGQHQRVAALQRVLDDGSTSLRVRVAACLVLLFAQPVSRIVRMTVDDVLHDGQYVALRLGDPPTPVPEPVTDLLLDYLRNLPASTPAINQNSPWLFPGRRTSQPMNPGTLRDALRNLGVPVEKGRTSAIRQLVLQAPAPRHRPGTGLPRQEHHPHRRRRRSPLEELRAGRSLPLRRPPPLRAHAHTDARQDLVGQFLAGALAVQEDRVRRQGVRCGHALLNLSLAPLTGSLVTFRIVRRDTPGVDPSRQNFGRNLEEEVVDGHLRFLQRAEDLSNVLRVDQRHRSQDRTFVLLQQPRSHADHLPPPQAQVLKVPGRHIDNTTQYVTDLLRVIHQSSRPPPVQLVDQSGLPTPESAVHPDDHARLPSWISVTWLTGYA